MPLLSVVLKPTIESLRVFYYLHKKSMEVLLSNQWNEQVLRTSPTRN